MVYPEITSPLSEVPVYRPKKKRKLILLSLAIGGLLIVSGVAVLGIWFLAEDTDIEAPSGNTCLYNGVKYKDGKSFEAADGCNTCTCKDGNVSCTLMACDNSSDTETEDWLEYTDEDERISFQYPTSWELEEDDYNPLGYKVTVSNNLGYAITFEGNEGDYGDYCVYSDSTDTLPSNYSQGVMGRIEFEMHTEFEQNYILYRIAQSPDNTQKYIMCEYDDHTNFFTTIVSNGGFVTYTIPDETPNSDMIETLNLIFYSRR